MLGVASLLAAAAVAYVPARRLGLPPVPFLLLAGLGLSLTAPPPAGVLEDALVLGVAFLLFVAGLELDPRRLGAQRSAALRAGVVQFAAMATVGFGAAVGMGFTGPDARYLALALAASSTLVGVRLLKQRQQMFEPFGRLVLGVLLVQDLLVLLAVPFLTRFDAGLGAVSASLASVLLLGAACLAVRRWVAPWLLEVDDEGELVLLASLCVLFAFLGAASLSPVPTIVGAFLAGVALARFPVNGVVRSRLGPVADFFTVLFFTALGARVGLPSLGELRQAGAVAALVLLVTPPLVAVIAERAGLAARSAVEAGLMLAQTSEISLVIVLAGVLEGDVGTGAFTVVALVTMITMLLTPVVTTDAVARGLVRFHPSWQPRGPGGPPPQGHVLLLGAGATGQRLLDVLLLAGADVVVVEDDPAVVGQLRKTGTPVIRGDPSAPRVLERAGAARARLVVSTLERPRDNRVVLETVADRARVLVEVFDEADARWVQSLGGKPVLSSVLAAERLLEWYGTERETLERKLAARVGDPGRGAA